MRPAHALFVLSVFALALGPAVLPAGAADPVPVAQTAGPTAAAANETLVGPALPPGPADESAFLAVARDVAADEGVSLPANARVTRLFTGGEAYLVVTERRLPAGIAAVRGEVVPPGPDAPGLVVATEASVSTEGTPVDFQTLLAETERYDRTIVSTSARARTLSLAFLGGPSPETLTLGYTTLGVQGGPLVQVPGRTAQSVLLGTAGSLTDLSVYDIDREFPAHAGFELVTNRPLFWAQGPATVEGVVLSNRTQYEEAAGSLIVTGIRYDGRELPGPTAARTRANLTGEVVTFEADLAGRRMSASDALLAEVKCGANAVRPPGFNTSCRPLVADVTVHAGVLSEGSPQSRAATLPYVGLSGAAVNGTATVEGRYRVTGRVVDSERVDPRLPGDRALVVYDTRRVGAGEPPSRVDRWAGITLELLRGQLTMNYTEWQETVAADPGSPAPGDDLRLERPAVPQRVVAGEPVAVTVTLNNTALVNRSVVLELRDGETVYDLVNATVAAGGTRNVTFEFAVYRPGAHDLTVNGEAIGTVQVEAADTTTTTDGQAGFGAALGTLALALVALALWRR